jgi:tRNA A-37 threonylcarbamoyl transferase component Bud32
MVSSTSNKPTDRPETIANRYRVDKTIGQGGMARVFQAQDLTHNKKVAVKWLSIALEDEVERDTTRFFEYEFHTLSQLAHPRVVAVLDFGKDDSGLYYTMELLGGGDLRELSPIPWPKACALLCDICSALSLLHSRRLVHRDLTPRNIRCTQDGKAKLIDFGAMIPFGTSKQVVGTPSFTAPEVFSGQSVDARTDLFSLGATAYYALTGHNAYLARNFDALRDAWRRQPYPPSTYVPQIPKELDQLVMSLIHLDPVARPKSAAEVMERLSAIAGVRIDEQLVVRQAYLTTPTLVGRDDSIQSFRKRIVRAMRGRGGAVLVTGTSGMGRSRFLDACVLEGKLSGGIVLRADAVDANPGNWGVAQSISRQLLEALGQTALRAARPRAPVLGHILPELLGLTDADSLELTSRLRSNEDDDSGSIAVRPAYRRSDRPSRPSSRPANDIALINFDTPQELRRQVHIALCDWLTEVAEHKCVVVAVDDIHRIDEPSAAFIALLSDRAPQKSMVVVVTAQTDAPATSQRALALLSQTGARIKLRNLSSEDTEKLLTSVFGEVPNIRLLADRLHAVSEGNPRTIMQLAQYLLDKEMTFRIP